MSLTFKLHSHQIETYKKCQSPSTKHKNHFNNHQKTESHKKWKKHSLGSDSESSSLHEKLQHLLWHKELILKTAVLADE